ncbi:MAG: hypothetical protein JRG71_16030 [Deltaproteobacteria bacterium]|nr:hypothetical protein [Deltaproteobacteria bacterium]
MKHRHTRYFILTNSRGATLVLVAILMTVLIGFAALAIDIGYVATTRNELQNISDAAALAAAGKLGEIYMNNGSYSHVSDHTKITGIAQEVGTANQAAGLPIDIAVDDIHMGSWSSGAGFTDNTVDPDAVRVTVRRDDSLNGNIATFFARVFGKDSVAVMADAVAALTGPAVMDPGVLKLPIGLSERQFPNNCKEPITFGDTLDSCAGWHNFGDPINGNLLSAKLIGMIVGHPDGPAWLATNYPDMNKNKIPAGYDSPVVTAGETIFNFQGGSIASLFLSGANEPEPMPALFDFWKERDDDEDYNFPDQAPFNIDGFDPDDVWVATVPVYADSSDRCENPTGELLIVGQADVIVTQINGPPAKSIDAVIDCNYKALRGGGAGGGSIGAIPNLVE